MKRSLIAAFALAVAGPALGQVPSTGPTASSAAPAAAPTELTVETSANPELVGTLVKQLGVTPKQAEGGAGALFGLAKSSLKTDEYASVAKAVPGIDGLLKSAPGADTSTTKGALMGAAANLGGKTGGLASLTGSFSKLGLKGDTVNKFAPIVLDYAKSKGGDSVGKLLGGVFK